jgi:microcin C transport system substrate-binding protein
MKTLLFLIFNSLLLADSSFSLLGEKKYDENFTHFEYSNPEAPKGGDIIFGVFGTYDSLNHFNLRGETVQGLELIYDTLFVKSGDEIASYYGLLAKDINISSDWKSVIFTIHEDARFSDGKSVLAEDVNFTFQTLLTKGSPIYKAHLRGVGKIEILGERKIKFEVDKKDLITTISTIKIFSKEFFNNDIPVGSGAYKIEKNDFGSSIKYIRRDDYWGKDLSPNVGKYNFDSITYDYYRDENVLFEALKSLRYHFRYENISKNWVTGYDGLQEKFTIEEIPHKLSQGMQGFWFNTRLPKFQDVKIRQGIALAFDFEWANRNLFYGQYKRSNSFFSNSIFDSKEFQMPEAGGSYQIRPSLRKAMRLLISAGCYLQNGKLYLPNGEQLKFTLLLGSSGFVKVALPFKRNLGKLGIDLEIEVVDPSQYYLKYKKFEFDMVVRTLWQPLLVGSEQFSYWHSSLAKVEGSQNLSGIENQKIDSLIEKIGNSENFIELQSLVFELDRELLKNFYVIPHWHIDKFRVAYWKRVHRPEISPLYDLNIENWWFE